ncbi:hypothetical protein GR925_27455 [Streptomyces sp. HUCO-GS316]|uniref:hypothetical protein n=1 Tax=Streptomyces sp. HUCO-GS316 TaxID=2692198 RepID=UPI00136E7741|nr:hypothetical protein [Streptomyces sp. HUCO-GS316]MXM67066.1 hypothetical protein [Streptomyces sp. HUCO-GS316]
MPLHDTDALIIETATAAESLPDPTTVAGRTHELANTATVSAVWSAPGATPFLVDGVPAATLTVLAGRARRVQSDGTRWVVAPTAARRVFAATAVSDASGNATFTFTPAFAAAPVVSVGLATTNTNATEARVTALSASSCTVNVRQSPGVVILGISVLQVPQPLSGATVHLLAIEAGQGV